MSFQISGCKLQKIWDNLSCVENLVELKCYENEKNREINIAVVYCCALLLFPCFPLFSLPSTRYASNIEFISYNLPLKARGMLLKLFCWLTQGGTKTCNLWCASFDKRKRKKEKSNNKSMKNNKIYECTPCSWGILENFFCVESVREVYLEFTNRPINLIYLYLNFI